jgi:hypothetical protein
MWCSQRMVTQIMNTLVKTNTQHGIHKVLVECKPSGQYNMPLIAKTSVCAKTARSCILGMGHT